MKEEEIKYFCYLVLINDCFISRILSVSDILHISRHHDTIMSAPEPMQKLFAAIDNNKEKFIENLSKAVAIKSVSAWPDTRPEITKMMKVRREYFNY